MVDVGLVSMGTRVVLCCIVFLSFIFYSLKTRFKCSVFKTYMYLSALILFTVIMELLFLIPDRFLSDYNIPAIITWILAAVLVFRSTIKGSCFELLFIVLAALNLYVNIVAVSRIIVNYMKWDIPEDVVIMGVLLIYIPLLWVFWCRLYKRVIEFYITDLFGKVIWIIPALTYIVFYVKIVSDYWKHPVNAHGEDVAFIVFWSFVTYAFFAVTLLMLIQAYKGISAADEIKLVEEQLRMQQEEYANLLERNDETARTKHDIRHHLLTIRGLAEKEDLGELRTYLDELVMKSQPEGEAVLCEQHVVNVILRHYYSIAKRHNIRMDITCSIPHDLKISDIDLCVIFGNLVENAVEACVSQKTGSREVSIHTFMQESQMALEIKNTYNGMMVHKDGEFYSTKHKGAGVGISSARRVIEKYNGILEIEYDQNQFRVIVLISVKR